MSRNADLRVLAHKCSELLEDKYQVRRVFLMGSLVRGIVHEKSDIDLVVEGLPSDMVENFIPSVYTFCSSSG